VYETDYDLTIRTRAPVETVWDELRTLERLLENTPTVSSFSVDDDGRHASLVGGLTRWPVAWRSLAAEAEIVEVDPPHRLDWTLTVAELDLRFAGTFELTPVSAEETNLTYRGSLRCGDSPVCLLRHVLAGILEGHMEALATRLATRAARRTAAEQALGAA